MMFKDDMDYMAFAQRTRGNFGETSMRPVAILQSIPGFQAFLAPPSGPDITKYQVTQKKKQYTDIEVPPLWLEWAKSVVRAKDETQVKVTDHGIPV